MTATTSSLLVDIQQALLASDTQVAPILLKVRFLANRLGSDILEQWVRHEAEGYPDDTDVPQYRTSPVSFTGDFSGAFGGGLNNAPIPSNLIEKFAGDEWTTFKIRQSIAEIDDLLTRSQGSEHASVQLPAANNLILVLQGKIYPKMACNRVLAEVPISAFSAIQSIVRSRLLDLTLELERNTNAADVTVSPANVSSTQDQAMMVNNITKQVIQGNSYTTLTDTRGASQVIVSVQTQDLDGLRAALIAAGLDESSATELAQTVADDSVTKDVPIGVATGKWLKENATGVATNVLSNVLSKLALQFHGLG